jgi:glycosyltransferase involved in cell wall biosynthesis
VKNLLIITYYWPPAGGAGVQRWLKFSKYLPEFGWKPIVLTVDPKKATYPQRDDTLIDEVGAGVEVIRTDSFEPLQLYGRLVGSERIPYGGFAGEKSVSRISRFLRGNFFIPDARKGWNRFAIPKAKELIADRSIECVITTGPPHSTHLIGLRLKQVCGIKWGIDLRDPWTEVYYSRERIRTPMAERRDLRYEKAVLGASDFCITASHGFAELFSRKVERKYHVITNGFDGESVSRPEKAIGMDDKLIISYTGTMAESYEPDVVFEALGALDRSFELRLAGSTTEGIKKRIDSWGLSDRVAHLGYLPHSEVLEEMHRADVLLLITPKVENAKGIIPGKLFEYLNTGNPILALTEDVDGDVARILGQTGSGRVFQRKDRSSLEDFLKNFSKSDEPAYPIPSQYHRRVLTERLVEVLDEI